MRGQFKKIYKIDSLKSILGLVCAVFFASIYPVLFLWGSNANVVGLSDVILPLSIYSSVSFLTFVVITAISRKLFQSAVCVVSMVILFSNYIYIERGMKGISDRIRYWHVLSVCIALFVVICALLLLKASKNLSKIFLQISSVFFCSLIVVNMVLIFPSLIKPHSKKSMNTQEKVESDFGGRNVYFLLFDEYASNDFMLKYYNYDNSNFTDTLEILGFSVNYSGRNECASTQIITTNIFNMDYVVSYADEFSNRSKITEKRHNNKTFDIFRSVGYSINIVGITEFYGFPSLVESDFNHNTGALTASGENFTDVLLNNTPFHIYSRIDPYDEAEKISEGISFLQNPENFRNGSCFVLSHLIVPHPPFVFDKNGNPVKGSNTSNWDDKKYYLEQYIYTTTLMLDTIENILENDSNAVVVLASDHSARASTKEGHQIFEGEDMCLFFSAVYLGGDVKVDIEGLSGINVWRTVLNEIFDLDYDMIPYEMDSLFIDHYVRN